MMLQVEPLTFAQIMKVANWPGEIWPNIQVIGDEFFALHGDKNPAIIVTKPEYLKTQEFEARSGVLLFKGDPAGRVESDDCWVLWHDLITTWSIKTRDQARNTGEKRYWPGKTCKRGHVSQRYTSTGTCCECTKIANSYLRGNDPKQVVFKVLVHKDDLHALEATHKALKINRLRQEAEKLERS